MRIVSKAVVAVVLILLCLSILANIQLLSTLQERQAQIRRHETEAEKYKIEKNAMQALLKLVKEDLEREVPTSGWISKASAGVTLSTDPSVKKISYHIRSKLEWEIVRVEERWEWLFKITVSNEGSEEIRIKDISIELPLVIFWDRTEDFGTLYQSSLGAVIPKGTVLTLGPHNLNLPHVRFKDKPLKILYKVSLSFAVVIDGEEYLCDRPIVIDNLWVYD